MDKATAERLEALAADRDSALKAYEDAQNRVATVVRQRPASMSEMATALGVSRQALYQLLERKFD